MKDEQELNKKLGEGVGFRYQATIELEHNICRQEGWIYPDGSMGNTPETLFNLPNFIQSLDACFKHLVPLAIDIIMAKQECSSDFAYATLFKKWLQELELIIPEAALALCLAIEKVISNDYRAV